MELIERYIPLAKTLAKYKKRLVSQGVYYEDLEAAAYFGLVDAASRYTESKGKFKDYASLRILGEMNDYLRGLKWGGRNGTVNISPLSEKIQTKHSNTIDSLFTLLPEPAHQIFCWYYIDCLTLKQIGDKLNLPECNVSRLMKRYRKYLKHEIERSR